MVNAGTTRGVARFNFFPMAMLLVQSSVAQNDVYKFSQQKFNKSLPSNNKQIDWHLFTFAQDSVVIFELKYRRL